MHPEIAEVYGNKVRIRVLGLCWKNDSILMVKHRMGTQTLWAPPGGGLEFGESLGDALKREFLEETGLGVESGNFLFGCEFVKKPLHAIELFFEVNWMSGELKRGYDPELQMIQAVQFLSQEEIDSIPREAMHGIFTKFGNVLALRGLTGFYRI